MMRSISFFFVYFILLINVGFSQKQENLKITHLPYLQALTDSTASIVWTTNRPSIAWVEIAPDDSTHFYQTERPKIFASHDGFKTIDTVHRVDLRHLKPNTKYRYRVYSTEVLSHEWVHVEYGKTVATNVYREQPLTFQTPGPTSHTKFAVINDIHGRNEVMNTLLDRAELDELDFVVFNGDMANNLVSENQMFEDYMDTAIERFAKEKAFYYARGNHETRGSFSFQFSRYFPTPNGKLYYMFTHGETAFIILDTGEDKPDSDIEYSGIVDMDAYRSEQAEWLKKAVEEPKFKNAKYKIVVAHIPPLGRWHGEQDLLDKFVPILNKAKIDIMLSAHYHRHLFSKESQQIHFPILVNSNNNVIKVDIDSSRALVRVLDQEGKTVEEYNIQAGRK